MYLGSDSQISPNRHMTTTHPEKVSPSIAYDWAFIGMGAANCILLQQLQSTGLLTGRSLVVIDPVQKTKDDKTYCFWAEDDEPVMQGFSHVISNSWPQVIIDGEQPQSIAPKRYHRVRSIDLYRTTQELLNNIGATCLPTGVNQVVPPEGDTDGPIELLLSTGPSVWAQRVFDSRTPKFVPRKPTDVRLVQSFVGFRILLQAPPSAWRTDAIRMMDFQVTQGPKQEVQFMYVLPEGPQEGLVELTRFGEETLTRDAAEPILEDYIASHFGTSKVLEVETGNIPMSNAPMQHQTSQSHPRWTAMGTRAGAVKPSTGYAFKAMTAHAREICTKLQAKPSTNQSLERRGNPRRFAFYDHLLLLILRDEPKWGKPVFQRLFSTQKTHFVLDFLDERTNLLQEASMFARLHIMPFLRALAKRSLGRMRSPAMAPSASWLLVVLGFFALQQLGSKDIAETTLAGLLAAGLVVIGIPHGALDAVTSVNLAGRSQLLFYAQYLSILGLTLAGWWFMPNLTLLVFLGMSAWHFGQGDTQLWGKQPRAPLQTMAWGGLVLAFLLGLHLPEANQILLPLRIHAPALSRLIEQREIIATVLWAAWLLTAIGMAVQRNWAGLISVLTLAAAAQMPLLLGFGTYFVFHHSVSGWLHLRQGTGLSHTKLYAKGLPFTAAAFVFMAAGVAWVVDAQDASFAVGAFFATLSALSLPHIVSSHHFLQATWAKRRA